jgi:hypothetical protein
MEIIMNIRLAIYAAGFALLLGTGATLAQDVVITPERETVIREYVHKKPLASIELPGVELNVGTPLPETVELYEIEAPDIEYRYVVVDGRTVLVDPETRQIVGFVD